MVSFMKKKIAIASFFITIIILAQLIVVMPSVIADDSDTPIDTITLSDDELNRFQDGIESLSDTDIYDDLVLILEENINENNELSISGLHDMIIFLNNSLDKSLLNSELVISNIIELLKTIVFIIMLGIAAIPVATLVFIVLDMIGLIQNFAEIVFDVAIMIYIPYLGLIPGLFLLIDDLEELIDRFMDMPINDDDKKSYIRQKFRDARSLVFKLMVLYTADTIFYYYVKPTLGYIGEFATYLFNICYYSTRVVQDAIITIEWFKTIFIDPAKSFFDFVKTKGLEKIQKLVVFGQTFAEAIRAADDWIWEVGIWIALGLPYPGFTDLSNLIMYLDNVFDYYNSKPWLEPISVYVTIKNEEDDEVTISFADPLQEDSQTFKGTKICCLTYYTDITETPRSSHKINVTAVEDDQVKTATTSGFSDGETELEFNFKNKSGKSYSKSKKPISCLITKIKYLLYNLQKLISKILSNNIWLQRFNLPNPTDC